MLSEQDIIAYLDNSLPPAERARIETEIAQQPELRRNLWQQSQMDAALRVALGNSVEHERVKQSVLAVVRGESEALLKQHVLADTTFLPRRGVFASVTGKLFESLRRPAWAIGFATVCVCMVFGIWFATRPSPQKPNPLTLAMETPARVDFPAGTVIHPRPGTKVQHDGSAGSYAPQIGDGLRVSDSGSGTITFSDGTVLHLEPGTEIRFQPVANLQRNGGKQIRLLSGSLSADVMKQPPGLPLLIGTPHALVTVVGTEFDLLVGTNQTQLEVTRGLVELSGASSTQMLAVAAGELAVAAEGSLPTQRLARNPLLWPFSSDSPWNTPVGAGAQFQPLSGNPFLADGTLTNAMRSRKPFMGRPTDPLRNVWINGQRRADVRLADSALPRAGLRDPIVLLQRARRYALELRGVTVRADGDIEAEASERMDLAGPGVNNFAVEAIPFGLSNLGGLIRAGEYEHGIQHALAARVRRNLLEGNNFAQPTTVWPATGNEVRAAQTSLRIGTLLAIPPDVDIRVLAGNSGPGYELARAMQDYGVYITGFIDAPFVLLTGEARLDLQVEDALLNQLVPRLQVVVNNTPQTPGGGGTPRRSPAPALPAVSR